MRKYKLIRAAIIAGTLSLLNPVMVKGEEQTFFGHTEEDLKKKAKSLGNTLYDWCVEVEEIVNEKAVDPLKEKASEIELYQHESLWLITDMPNKSPSEARHYYFVNKNTPSIRATYSYDKFGNKVKNNSRSAVKREQREMFVSLTDLNTVFKIEYWLDLTTYEFTVNYQDFDAYTLYEENADYQYGRFVNIEDIVPDSLIQEKYSTKELEHIENYLNNLEYQIISKETYCLKKKN